MKEEEKGRQERYFCRDENESAPDKINSLRQAKKCIQAEALQVHTRALVKAILFCWLVGL